MTLNPDDIVNKKFQTTKFREGYDQDEVDDYLDEIVVELRKLLDSKEGSSSELNNLSQELNSARQELANTRQELTNTRQELAKARQDLEQAAAFPPQPAAPEPVDYNAEVAEILALAKRTHDEYVNEAVKKRDAMLAEAQRDAVRIVESSEKQNETRLTDAKRELAALEQRIVDLRNFENDYRTKLRAFLQGGLRDLDNKANS